MPRAGIALGSNLGDRSANLAAAVSALMEIAAPGEPFLTAPVYQTKPRLCPPGSPDFLNTVVEIGWNGGPLELLGETRMIEEKLGRVRGSGRNEPRMIDIDLLYFGAERMNDEVLVLPHPRIGERRFVLQPLADIRPELVLPGHNRTVGEMLRDMNGDEAPVRVEPPSSGK